MRPITSVREPGQLSVAIRLLLVVFLSALALVFSPAATAVTYVYTPFEVDPNTWTVPWAINNAGHIVGSYGVDRPQPRMQAFVYDGSTVRKIGFSTWGDSVAEGINNADQVVGWYRDSSGNLHGFIWETGTVRTYDVPVAGATQTVLTGINDAGELVGHFNTADGNGTGFKDANGSVTLLRDFTHDTNNAGQAVGVYFPNDSRRGYLYSNGTYTTVPPVGDLDSQAWGINNAGHIVGDYWTSSARRRGYLYDGTSVIPFDHPHGVNKGGTQLLGINDDGVVVGAAYGDVTLGFVARPTVLAIPGIIQAEDFDHGSQGVTYNDTSAANEGGADYRNDSVDIEVTQDSGGGFDVGWVTPGEWLQYTVNVASAGIYTVEVRYAAEGFGGTMHINFNGDDKTGEIVLPDSGGWQTWRSVTKADVALEAGEQTMRLAFDTGSPEGWLANINYVRLTAQSTGAQSPFPAGPHAIPGTVQAENFDNGGEGVAYHDSSADNEGGSNYRTGSVDVETTADAGGGHDVGWITPNEWLEYTVNVTAGTYTVEVRYAALGFGGTMHVEFDGQDRTGSILLPDSGGWQTWETASISGVALSGGQQTMRLVFDTGSSDGWLANLNWVRFTRVSP